MDAKIEQSRPLVVVGHSTAGRLYEAPRPGEVLILGNNGELRAVSRPDAPDVTGDAEVERGATAMREALEQGYDDETAFYTGLEWAGLAALRSTGSAE